MEKLWSPWRSNYISSFKDKKEDDNRCVFCEVPKEDISNKESLIVYKGEKVFKIIKL